MKAFCEKHSLGHYSEMCPLCRNATLLESEEFRYLDNALLGKLIFHFEEQEKIHLLAFRKDEAEAHKRKNELDELSRRYEHLKQESHDFDIRKKAIMEGAFAEIRKITESNFNLYLSNLKPYSEDFFDSFEVKLEASFKKLKFHERWVSNMVIKVIRKNLKDCMNEALLSMSDKKTLAVHRDKYAKRLTGEMKAPLDRAINAITQEAVKVLDSQLEKNNNHKKSHSTATKWGAFVLFGIAAFAITGAIFLLSQTNLANIQSGWAIVPFSSLFLLSVALIFMGMRTLWLVSDLIIKDKQSELFIDVMFSNAMKGTQLSTELAHKLNELKNAVKNLVERNQSQKQPENS